MYKSTDFPSRSTLYHTIPFYHRENIRVCLGIINCLFEHGIFLYDFANLPFTLITFFTMRVGCFSEVSEQEKHILTVLDIQNKFIVFTAPMRQVRGVLVEWGSLYVLCGDHTISMLVEKDLQSKLALLFKKNLYDVSIR